jgi:hypothetical protein
LATPGSVALLQFGLVVAMCVGGMSLPGEEESPRRRSVHSLVEIQQAVGESRERLQSILAEFVATGRDPRSGQVLPVSNRTVFAAKGMFRFASYSHFTTGVPDELDVEQNQVFFTGDTLDVYYPLKAYYETSRESARLPSSWKVRAEFFLECLAWWPPTDGTTPPGEQERFYLHDALRQPGCRVLPHQEKIDGAWCHVVERAGVDKVWLDPALGFAMRRREWAVARPPLLCAHYELSDYREARRRVWIPWRLRRVLYRATGAATDSGGVVDKDVVCTMVRVEVNQVEDSIFRFAPPPGTLVEDRDTGEIRQVPGGAALLDAIADVAQKRMVAASAGRKPEGVGAAPSRLGTGLALVAVVVVLAAFGANLVRCLWRNRSSASVSRSRRANTDEEGLDGLEP